MTQVNQSLLFKSKTFLVCVYFGMCAFVRWLVRVACWFVAPCYSGQHVYNVRSLWCVNVRSEVQCMLRFLTSKAWPYVCNPERGVLLWVCVRSGDPCCVLWYLGSGSSVRPSGSLRSRRSEACNYWSPPGPLWGRYGSSDACCSCADVKGIYYFFPKERDHVCYSTCVCVCAGLFLVWTAWVMQSHWREREAGKWICVCGSGRVTQSKGTPASRGLQFSSSSRVETNLAENISTDPTSRSHIGDLIKI